MDQFGLVDVTASRCSELGIVFAPAYTAGDVMETEVVTLTLDDTVKKCLEVMKVKKVRHVCVVDLPAKGEEEPFFVGIISQRDILRLKPPDGKEGGRNDIYPKALGQLLGQVVARNPVSVEAETPMGDVLKKMLANHIDMLPVSEGTSCVGFITTTDIVKILVKLAEAVGEIGSKDGFGDSEESAALSAFGSLAVGDVMAGQVTCMEEEDTLIKAIDVLKKAKFRHVLVTDEFGNLKGLVSDRDILRQLPFAGTRPPKGSKEFRADLFRIGPKTRNLNVTMRDIMTPDVEHVAPECKMLDAARTMLRLKVGCLAVVDRHRRIRGIVTLTDLMRAMLSLYESTDQSSSVRQKANA
jgi:CBS domain-containing protein